MSSIDNVKATMGWHNPSQRAACWNCIHSTNDGSGAFGAIWRCGNGGFITSRLAICDEHQPKEGDPRK
jgi:hypothetical protein